MDSPLKAFPLIWLKNIKRARARRAKEFDADAEKALAFYDGDHEWVFNKATTATTASSVGGKSSSENFDSPDFKMTVNRTFEFVSIMGPMVYNQNPTVLITPREFPEIPPEVWGNMAMGQQATQMLQSDKMKDKIACTLLSTYLNYIPNETKMTLHARKAIDEALITGLGCMYTEVYTPIGSQTKMVRATYVKNTHVVWDPDASYFGDVQWLAIECCHPVHEVEAEYGLQPGSLGRGTQESTLMTSAMEFDSDLRSKYERNRGETYDTLTYWKIFSKIGVGSTKGWLGEQAGAQLNAMIGPYAFFAVAPGVDYPLNFGPDAGLDQLETDPSQPGYQQSLEFLRQRFSWQVPHFLDDAWPIEFLTFYDSPGCLYPMSPLKPAFGEQYAIDWIYSMMISKLRVACRSILAVAADAPPEVMDILNNGADYQVVQLGKAGILDKYIQQFSFQPFAQDIWHVLQGIEQNFSQRTGLLPMLYGAQGERQVRTAAEGNALSTNLNIRPQHLKDQVEAWFTRIIRRLALATRFHIKGPDIIPLMGQEYAQLWDQVISNVSTESMVREYQYRIESGSTRKPTPETQTANLEQASQQLMPALFQAMGTNPQNAIPLNYLVKQLMKNRGMEWPVDILPPMPPTPPPGPVGPGPGGPPPGGPQGPPPPPGQHPDQSIPPQVIEQMLKAVAGGQPTPPPLHAIDAAAQQTHLKPKDIAQEIIKQLQDPSHVPPLPPAMQNLPPIEKMVAEAVEGLMHKEGKASHATLSDMLMGVAHGQPAPPQLRNLSEAAHKTGIPEKQIAETIIKQAHEPHGKVPASMQNMSEIQQAVVMAVKELTSKKRKMSIVRDENDKIVGLQEE